MTHSGSGQRESFRNKYLALIISLLLFFNADATNYYFAASGNDGNTGTISSPWQTIAKFNSVFASKSPGDQFLFNGGDTFTGTLIISRNGSAGLPITIGSYGTGSAIINGFANLTGWTSIGTNIWESSSFSTRITCNMVSVNSVNTGMGRTPNYPMYYQWNSPAGSGANTTLNSVNLNSSAINWQGAEIAVWTSTFRVNRHFITGHSGQTITYNSTNSADGFDNPGTYFIPNFQIQNDPRTLDVQNEWYYNPSTKKLRIYSTSSPTNVRAAMVDTLCWINHNFITIDNLSFLGSNKDAVELGTSNTCHITNCTFNYIGRTCVFGSPGSGTGLEVSGCNMNNINGNGVDVEGSYTAALVTNNTIRNVGMIVGMSTTFQNPPQVNPSQLATGILVTGAGSTISYNTLDSIGYIGIRWDNNNSTVNNNFVDHFCIANGLKDGGGIYTSNQSQAVKTGMRNLNNITLHSGAFSVGNYMDDYARGIELAGNTVAFCGEAFQLHNATFMNIHDNTNYDCDEGMIFLADDDATTMNNITLKNNIFFGRTASQDVIMAYMRHNPPMAPPFTSDSNYFCRPIDDNLVMQTYFPPNFTHRNLAMWQTLNGQDAHSKKSPVTISNVNQLFFCYNPTTHDSIVTLPAGTWIDARGVTYNTGSITLHNYTSAVLINTGTNVAPIANAGTNKNITLPTSSVTQVGSGSDADGTIASYQWTNFSGPATPTFGSATSATTTINGMSTAGTYVVQIKVTDNKGLTATDTASIIVNASTPVNVPPTANAGGNKNITLPVSTVTQVGSGTDTDGTVVSYSWAKKSGPAAGTIVSPTSATTVINNLTLPGTYAYELTVTDNLGATGTQTATIIVNTAAPIAPVANAGADQSITWPTNSVTLSGSGTDADGTVVAYNWTKISGPALYTITNSSSASTTVTNLDIGVYQFQLQVTDNSGGTDTDVTQVTVSKGSATINVSGTSKVYNGAPQGIDATTTPAGISTSTTYNGSTTQPTNAGAYSYITGITDPHWNFTPASGTFTITKAAATINAVSKTVNFDGNPQTISSTTTPGGLTVLTTLYNGNPSPPSAIGVYSVAISLANANYQATTVNVTLTIQSNPAIIFISDTTKVYNGSAQSVTVTSQWPYSLTGSPQTNAGSYAVNATINDGIHTGSANATFTISKKPSVLTWTQPAPMPYGALLSLAQLNASTATPGTWTYNHIIGEQLPIGPTTITATFTPTDAANNTGGTISVTISVFGVNPFTNAWLTGNNFFFIEQ